MKGDEHMENNENERRINPDKCDGQAYFEQSDREYSMMTKEEQEKVDSIRNRIRRLFDTEE